MLQHSLALRRHVKRTGREAGEWVVGDGTATPLLDDDWPWPESLPFWLSLIARRAVWRRSEANGGRNIPADPAEFYCAAVCLESEMNCPNQRSRHC